MKSEKRIYEQLANITARTDSATGTEVTSMSPAQRTKRIQELLKKFFLSLSNTDKQAIFQQVAQLRAKGATEAELSTARLDAGHRVQNIDITNGEQRHEYFRRELVFRLAEMEPEAAQLFVAAV